MAKLPTPLLPRSLLASPSTSSTTLLTSTYRPSTIPTTRTSTPTIGARAGAAPAAAAQVRYATQIARPKRPFTFTQIVQLSDGSTYTTRSTSPVPVYRSTKDTRNHLTWQPTESSLQNVEVDEAGKLASFRSRFGAAYDLAGPTAAEKQAAEAAQREAGAGGKDRKPLRKAAKIAAAREAREAKRAAKKEEANTAAETAAADAAAELDEDSFASLLAGYVRDQPNLKGGMVAGKHTDKKGKKK